MTRRGASGGAPGGPSGGALGGALGAAAAALLGGVFGGCAERLVGAPAAADPAAVYDAAWRAYDRHFAFFADKGLDWDAAYARHRAGLSAASPAGAVFDAVCALVRETGSLHSNLVAGGRDCTVAPNAALATFDPDAVRAGYVGGLSRTPGGRIRYGRFLAGVPGGADVGYVWVPNFGGAGWGGDVDAALAGLAAGGAPPRALVLDVRRNGGGDESVAAAVAGRFLDRERVYALSRPRSGPARDALGPPQPKRVAPAGPRFAGRVALLTDRGVASSAESFTLMLRDVPAVTVVGDTTSGTSGLPIPQELPNGWWVRVPAVQELTPDGALVIEGRGLPPAVVVRPRPGDQAAGVDRALEAALARLARP